MLFRKVYLFYKYFTVYLLYFMLMFICIVCLDFGFSVGIRYTSPWTPGGSTATKVPPKGRGGVHTRRIPLEGVFSGYTKLGVPNNPWPNVTGMRKAFPPL